MIRPLLLAGLLLAAALPASARDWTVDPAASRLDVTFMQGTSEVPARFETFDAKISFDPANLAAAKVEVRVDLGSFASGDAQRDAQAKGPDFLAAATGPVAIYRTLGFKPLGGDRYQVDAELELKGVTKQLSHEAVIKVAGDHATAEGKVPLVRTDYQVGTGQFATGAMVGLDVEVSFKVEAH